MNAEQLQTKAAEIYRRRDQRIAALRGPDGRPSFTPEEEATRRQAFELEASQALEALANEARNNAEYRAALIGPTYKQLRRGPLERLTAQELERANQLRPFIREDMERATYDQLTGRIEAAADPIERALVARYVLQRLEDDQQAAFENGQRPGPEWYELEQQARALEDSLIPAEEVTKRTEYEAQLEEIEQVRREAEQIAQWADPDYKRDFAARFGFDPSHVKAPYERLAEQGA